MSRLRMRNVQIGHGGPRTSMRMDSCAWSAAEEICHREGITLSQLAQRIDATQQGGRDRTAAMRAYILNYFRAAATEAGHHAAGHGALERTQ